MKLDLNSIDFTTLTLSREELESDFTREERVELKKVINGYLAPIMTTEVMHLCILRDTLALIKEQSEEEEV